MDELIVIEIGDYVLLKSHLAAASVNLLPELYLSEVEDIDGETGELYIPTVNKKWFQPSEVVKVSFKR